MLNFKSLQTPASCTGKYNLIRFFHFMSIIFHGFANYFFSLSSSWFKQWEQFVLGRQRDPPSQIDNKSIVTTRFSDRQPILRPSADYIAISADIWKMFHSIYGGGPEVILRSNGTSLVLIPKAISTSSTAKSRARSASESTIATSVSISSSPPK